MKKCNTCGRLHPNKAPKNARVSDLGKWAECLCLSTLFWPNAKARLAIARRRTTN